MEEKGEKVVMAHFPFNQALKSEVYCPVRFCDKTELFSSFS